jgi:hypothetical protein
MKGFESRVAASYGYCDVSSCDAKTKADLLTSPHVHWDRFYCSNKREFFKDRHWLLREFAVLSRVGLLMCEFGCGVGNSTFPLLEENASLRLHCSDFSPTAVSLLKSDPRFESNSTRILSCTVADCSNTEQVVAEVAEGSCDVVLLVFVLSAMPLSAMHGVVASSRVVLRSGGTVLVRDYAEKDAAQIRFEQTPGSRVLEENLCCRGDGTQAYFFRLNVLRTLWEEVARLL